MVAAPAYPKELARCKNVRAFVKNEARRESGTQVEPETRYDMTSLASNAHEILRAAPPHCEIDNSFNRSLDAAFRKHTSAIWLRHAAANFAVPRSFAKNLFRLDNRSKKSLPKKRNAAARNFDYVVELLNLRPQQDICLPV